MLYFSLGLSVVLLAAANFSVTRWRNPVPAVILLGIGFTVLPFCMMMLAFPAVAVQSLLLCLLLFISTALSIQSVEEQWRCGIDPG